MIEAVGKSDARGANVIIATDQKNVDDVVRLLAEGKISEYARSFAAFSAALSGQDKILGILLKNGPISYSYHCNAVSISASLNRVSCVQLLLLNRNTLTPESFRTTLLSACCVNEGRGNVELLKIILPRRELLSVDARSELVKMASEGIKEKPDIVQYLLENGPIYTKGRGEALFYPSQNGYLEVVKLLLNNGPVLESDLDAAIEVARKMDRKLVLEVLQQQKIQNKALPDNDGRTSEEIRIW